MDVIKKYCDKIYNFIRSMKIELTQKEEAEYLQEEAKGNRYSFRVLVSLVFVCELYNIIRVLYFSNSGLGTLNNRIYFTMYISLFLSGAIFLTLEYYMKENVENLSKLYLVVAFTWMFWHVAINCYELSKNPSRGMSTYIVAILTCAIFLQCRPVYSFFINAVTYMAFRTVTYHILDLGDRVNLLIVVLMAAVISGRRYVYSIRQIKQNVEIHNANEEMKRKQLELQMSLRKHEVIMEYTNDIIFEWNVRANTLQFSNNAQNSLTFPILIENVETWIMQSVQIHADDIIGFTNEMKKLIALKRAGDINLRLMDKNGKYVWYQARVFMQFGVEGQVLYAIGIMTNIDKQQRQLERLAIQSSKDPLTGVLNTKAFQQNYQQSIEKLELGEMIVMFMIDLDNFKEINDVCGHVCGDYVLKGIAGTLRKVFRQNDFLGRLGGDEFAAMMMRVKDVEIVKMKAEQILKGVSQLKVMNEDIAISCSIGIAMTKDVDMKYETLYNQADIALYQSKNNGKSCYYIYEE